jgi:hypothetical protein
MAATNPRDPDNLIGGAITYTRRGGGTATKAYASWDGGNTWLDATFPAQAEHGGGDPQVAFTPRGTAIFATLGNVVAEGRSRTGLHVYRSEDGGRTWGGMVDLGYSYDHPQIVVDHTVGRFAGRIYIGALYGREYSLGVFRSDDDGRSFIGPVKLVDGAGIGVNVSPLLVLGDGTLVVTYADFEIDPERRRTVNTSNLWAVASHDGGVTFSAPRAGHTVVYPPDPESPLRRLGTFPAYAVNAFAQPHRDRIYVAWTDFRSGSPRILTSTSDDASASWSEPRALDPGAPPEARQYQPSIAVNRDGVVAVSWFDTRSARAEGEYKLLFAASLDGGASFSAPFTVSSRRSRSFGPGNMRLGMSAWSTSSEHRLSIGAAAGRWGHGGDYMGLVADARGAFHPFWADARSGTFQAWTAAIRVLDAEAAAAIPTPDVAGWRVAEVTDDIEFSTDPTRYDAASKVLEIPLRLRNAGDRRLAPPLELHINEFGSGPGDVGREHAPVILNADNDRSGAGAVFDFSAAIGGFGVLEPGAQTGAVILQLRLDDPLDVPDFHVAVRAAVEPSSPGGES